jgi:hypothetical protein
MYNKVLHLLCSTMYYIYYEFHCITFITNVLHALPMYYMYYQCITGITNVLQVLPMFYI